jgi:hypothetical protein
VDLETQQQAFSGFAFEKLVFVERAIEKTAVL